MQDCVRLLCQIIKFIHRRDEDVAGFVAVLGADDADFFEPNGEARDEAVAFAKIGLEHGGAEFAFVQGDFNGLTDGGVGRIEATA